MVDNFLASGHVQWDHVTDQNLPELSVVQFNVPFLSGNATLYFNGQPVASKIVTPMVLATNLPLRVGATVDVPAISGSLGCLHIYNKFMTASDIASRTLCPLSEYVNYHKPLYYMYS